MSAQRDMERERGVAAESQTSEKQEGWAGNNEKKRAVHGAKAAARRVRSGRPLLSRRGARNSAKCCQGRWPRSRGKLTGRSGHARQCRLLDAADAAGGVASPVVVASSRPPL